MRIFSGECRKLWGNRQAWTGLFLLLVITVVIAWLDVRQLLENEELSDISAAYAKLEGMDPQQALVYMGLDQADETLLYQVSGGWQDWYYGDQLWPASVIGRVLTLAEIPDYVAATIREAQQKTTISIFAVKGFEKENLLRTKTVYQQLQELYTPVENHTAVELLLETELMDLLSAAYGLLILGILLGRERESGILQLYVTCKKGRVRLGCAKLAAACLWGMMAYLICAIARYGCAWLLAGDGSWSAPIQCLQGYEQSGCKISIGRYVSWYLGAKLLWLCGRMAQWYLLLQMIHTLPVAILISGGVWLAESVLYTGIDQVSYRYWIRCILPESLRQFAENVATYRCVDLWGHTVERLPVIWIAAVLWFLLYGVLAVLVFCIEAKGISVWSGIARRCKGRFFWQKYLFQKREKVCVSNRAESTFRHEGYKLLFGCGGALILVMTIWFQWNVRGYQLQPAYNYIDQICKGMIDPLEGEVTDELLTKIESIRRLYESDEEIYGLSLQILRSDIDPMCQYLSTQRALGKMVKFFYDLPWREYLGMTSTSKDVQDTFVLLLVMILVCCGQICMDYRHGEVAFLYVTKGGRKKMFQAKCRVAFGLYLTLLVLFTLLPFVEAMILSGAHTVKYPICSIQGYGVFSDRVSIGAYVVGLFLWRACMGLVTIHLIYGIAEKIRQFTSAVVVCFSLLGVSFVGYFLKSEILENVGLLPYLNGNRLMQHGELRIIVYLVVGVIAVCAIEWYYRRISRD